MFVCENCMSAIESREGRQEKTKYYFETGNDNTPVNQCEWCHEDFSVGEEVYKF